MKALSNSAICPKCGGGHKSKPFCLYHNGWYCFACGYTKASDRGYTIQEKIIEIPEWIGATNNYENFSLDVRIWLTERGITKEDVLIYKIYCDNEFVVFVGCKDPLYYQVRNVLDRSFKTYGKKVSTILKSNSKELVLVEDFLSAVNINKAGYNTVCLWGTSVSFHEFSQWFKDYEIILVWLDNDVDKQTNSGQEAAEKVMKMGTSIIDKYSLKYGFSKNCKKIVNIVADKDPKYYSNEEVRQIVRSALNEH